MCRASDLGEARAEVEADVAEVALCHPGSEHSEKPKVLPQSYSNFLFSVDYFICQG